MRAAERTSHIRYFTVKGRTPPVGLGRATSPSPESSGAMLLHCSAEKLRGALATPPHPRPVPQASDAKVARQGAADASGRRMGHKAATVSPYAPSGAKPCFCFVDICVLGLHGGCGQLAQRKALFPILPALKPIDCECCGSPVMLSSPAWRSTQNGLRGIIRCSHDRSSLHSNPAAGAQVRAFHKTRALTRTCRSVGPWLHSRSERLGKDTSPAPGKPTFRSLGQRGGRWDVCRPGQRRSEVEGPVRGNLPAEHPPQEGRANTAKQLATKIGAIWLWLKRAMVMCLHVHLCKELECIIRWLRRHLHLLHGKICFFSWEMLDAHGHLWLATFRLSIWLQMCRKTKEWHLIFI